MRDASRELPDRIHLLRLPQLRFQLVALGDIAVSGDEMGYRSMRISHRAYRLLQIKQLSVFLPVYQSAPENLARKNCRPEILVKCFALLS